MFSKRRSKFTRRPILLINGGWGTSADEFPSCWHQFKAQLVETRPLRQDDPGDDKEAQVLGL